MNSAIPIYRGKILLCILLAGYCPAIIGKPRQALKKIEKSSPTRILTPEEIAQLENWIAQQQLTSGKKELFSELMRLCKQKEYLIVLKQLNSIEDSWRNFPLEEARICSLTDQWEQQPWYIQDIGKLPEKKFQHQTEKISHLIDLTNQLVVHFEKQAHKDLSLLPIIRYLLHHCNASSNSTNPELHSKITRCIHMLMMMADFIVKDSATSLDLQNKSYHTSERSKRIARAGAASVPTKLSGKQQKK